MIFSFLGFSREELDKRTDRNYYAHMLITSRQRIRSWRFFPISLERVAGKRSAMKVQRQDKRRNGICREEMDQELRGKDPEQVVDGAKVHQVRVGTVFVRVAESASLTRGVSPAIIKNVQAAGRP